jgi:rRNA maturation endonuclease Nob1
MKGKYADRECRKCKKMIPAEDKYCPYCKTRQGRENENPETPGSYKGYVKKSFV